MMFLFIGNWKLSNFWHYRRHVNRVSHVVEGNSKRRKRQDHSPPTTVFWGGRISPWAVDVPYIREVWPLRWHVAVAVCIARMQRQGVISFFLNDMLPCSFMSQSLLQVALPAAAEIESSGVSPVILACFSFSASSERICWDFPNAACFKRNGLRSSAWTNYTL